MALKISLVLLFVLLLSKSLFVDSSPMFKRDDDEKCGITKNSREPKGLPSILNPAAKFKFLLYAAGDQIYKCNTTTPQKSWDLGRATWNSTLDCDHSSVIGRIIQTYPVEPENIPWLLIQTTKNEGENGAFSDVKFVVRTNTKGGVPPPIGELTSLYSLNEAHYLPYQKIIGTKTKQPIIDLPKNITIPTDRNFKFVLYGHGYQIYQCSSENKTWTLVTPVANLINDKNTEKFTPYYYIAKHYFVKEPINGGRPTWESIIKGDNSKVTTKIIATSASPDNPKKNVPWLVTQTTANSGNGVFADITHIIRVNTIKGIAPPIEDCGVKYKDKDLYYSEYYTDYWFYH
ncbi:6057_t:CDS:2 [Rhizophagus irregularis]|nr:6057_t:CDS:2 [Rhizophagus irregularis]